MNNRTKHINPNEKILGCHQDKKTHIQGFIDGDLCNEKPLSPFTYSTSFSVGEDECDAHLEDEATLNWIFW